ncbi:uncharacterized protein LOC125027862 [Penaeus chinensis]|uniref:uncharacterized protein LOC125027862 n=1 Tax=Penaeus chinensis TaxID=139456 RepID=UPI001FB6F417|nr:uncharacterized protein LOC125027862 [Penaeus chinensis]
MQQHIHCHVDYETEIDVFHTPNESKLRQNAPHENPKKERDFASRELAPQHQLSGQSAGKCQTKDSAQSQLSAGVVRVSRWDILSSKSSCSPSTAILDQQNNPIPSSLMYDQTSPLPAKALWNYVQWLLGIHHDDCDYNALNKHLDPQLKAFIKTACCFPETLSDSNTMTTNGVQARVVEASVIVMEARLQSELLYALRAIMLHQC